MVEGVEGRVVEERRERGVGVVTELPPNLHLLTLQQLENWEEEEEEGEEEGALVLVRVEHLYQVGEHTTLSLPASCSLSG